MDYDTAALNRRCAAGVHPEPTFRRFGLDLHRDAIEQLGTALERISDAKRSVVLR